MTGGDGAAVHLIDDDAAVRDSLAAVLWAAGLRVVTHESGRSFLSGFEAAATLCVVMDVWMPDGDGTEIQGLIAAADDPPPVIMITGGGEVDIAVRAMKAGAFDFLEKPFDPDHLIEQVRSAIAWGERNRSQRHRVRAARERLRPLTAREREVLIQLTIGHSNKRVARALGLSPRTVELHRARIMAKTGADSLSHLVRLALIAGLDDAVLRI